jgi:hypothetical protein
VKRPVYIFISLLVLVGLAIPGCAASISHQRISAIDLPGGTYLVTVYRSSSSATAVILDNPKDDIFIKPGNDRFRFKKRGMQTSTHYLADPVWKPEVFGLKPTETGEMACYLLVSPELRWLFSYNKSRQEISITIEDPNDFARGGL